ncbi:putative indole-3-pyruvate monooxygenase YUCCA10 [Platanthera zijinensis]|uniref:Flavin-containing monooxygenase n=1 Tax=Platanthera zijinensis TaxID=2320716 RepID=A0AAP0FZB1_9ASPA
MENQPADFSTAVLVIGAGPSGLAAAACLAAKLIPVLILERDDAVAPLWRRRTYARLRLQQHKRYCELPLFGLPPSAPTFLPCSDFIRYLDDYAAALGLEQLLRLRRRVDSAEFDPPSARWRIDAAYLETGAVEKYDARFLVVATGEDDEPLLPIGISGLDRFSGETVHSNQFRTGEIYQGLDVLVVGSGNSGMEIAYDLAECGARASLVVRRELHLVTREMLAFAMGMAKYLPVSLVDLMVLLWCYIWFGNTSKYGLHRPSKGPIYLRHNAPIIYPVVDSGAFTKIKSGDIEVLPAISTIEDNNVITFENGKRRRFDAIIFATGYRSTVKNWLKGDDYLIGEDGLSSRGFPPHLKGKNGLYCVGLSKRGLHGVAEDVVCIADDIGSVFHRKEKQT